MCEDEHPRNAPGISAVMKERNIEVKMPSGDHEGEFFFSRTHLWRKEELPAHVLLITAKCRLNPRVLFAWGCHRAQPSPTSGCREPHSQTLPYAECNWNSRF